MVQSFPSSPLLPAGYKSDLWKCMQDDSSDSGAALSDNEQKQRAKPKRNPEHKESKKERRKRKRSTQNSPSSQPSTPSTLAATSPRWPKDAPDWWPITIADRDKMANAQPESPSARKEPCSPRGPLLLRTVLSSSRKPDTPRPSAAALPASPGLYRLPAPAFSSSGAEPFRSSSMLHPSIPLSAYYDS